MSAVVSGGVGVCVFPVCPFCATPGCVSFVSLEMALLPLLLSFNRFTCLREFMGVHMRVYLYVCPCFSCLTSLSGHEVGLVCGRIPLA